MAFKIHGEVTLDGAMFKRVLHEISGETTEFIKNWTLGAIGIASVEQAFEKTVESASELVDTSRNLDMTVEQLQLMRQAAEENGRSFQTMTTAIERFNAVRENILRGGKGSAQQLLAMQNLGLSKSDLANQTAAQSMMGQISQTAQKSNAADIANDLKTVFGRGGDEIFGVLKTNFGELEEHMRSMGMIMDGITANSLKQISEQFKEIGKIGEATLGPVLVNLAKAVILAIASVESLARFFGGLTSKINASDFLHPFDFIKHLNEGLMPGLEAGQTAFEEAFDKILALNNPPEEPKPQSVIQENAAKAKAAKEEPLFKEKSDALIESGNFLGSGRHDISNIAKEHLDIAKQQLEKLSTIADKLNKADDSGFDKIDIED